MTMDVDANPSYVMLEPLFFARRADDARKALK